LYEEFAYAPDGSFLAGTFADYLVPTAVEVPVPQILHIETPSPFTPLGAKGVGEGNAMSTPVCIANAVADALELDDIDLPLTPATAAAPGPAVGGPSERRATSPNGKEQARRGRRRARLIGCGRGADGGVAASRLASPPQHPNPGVDPSRLSQLGRGIARAFPRG